MKKTLLALSCILLAGMKAYASNSIQGVLNVGSVMVSSSPAASNALATVTLSTASVGNGQGAYSSGYYDYITNVHIEAAYTGGVASNSAPVVCTTTNLSGTPSWYFGPAITTGTVQVMDMEFANPLVAVNTSSNTVVSCPATANVRWNVLVGHYVFP